METFAPEALAAQRDANALLRALPHPDPRTPDGLAAIRATAPPPARTELEAVEERMPHGQRLRLFEPPHAAGTLLRVHGGGFVTGAPEHDDALNDRLARETGLLVASPSYRLAPEHRYEDALADVTAALRHAAAVLPAPLLLAGTSAGSHLALRAALDAPDAVLAGLHLDCGRYDLTGTPSARAATDETLALPRVWLDGFLAVALPDDDEVDLRLRSPLHDPRLVTLHAPVLLTVGALDPLRDDSRRMADALPQGTLLELPEAPHSFLGSGTPIAEAAVAHVVRFLRLTSGQA